MSIPFASGEYGPELVSLMSDALDSAWKRAEPAPQDGDLARLVMASAIIEKVDAGVRDPQVLIASATAALRAAVAVSRGDSGGS